MEFTNKTLLNQVYKFSKPFRKWLIISFVLIGFITVIEACNSYFLSKIFDLIGGENKLFEAIFWCGLAGGSVIIKLLLSRWREILEVKKLGISIENHLTKESISKFFGFSAGQHIDEHSGVKQSIVQSGSSGILNMIYLLIYDLMPSLFQFIISIVIIFSVNFYFGGVYLLASFLIAYYLNKVNTDLKPKTKEVRDIYNSNWRLISEIYRYVLLIKNETAEKKSMENLSNAQGDFMGKYSKTWIWAINRYSLLRIGTQFFRWATIFVSVILAIDSKISSGDLFLIFMWTNNYIGSIWTLTELQKQFITNKVNIEKYFELLNIEPEIIIPKDGEKISNIENIKFDDISFAYKKRKSDHSNTESEVDFSELVLDGITFEINKGSKVGLVGESGSGKSTVINLLRRNFDPQSGSVKINDLDLKKIDLDSFLSKIGSVDQEVQLFDSTVRDNISFGVDRSLTDTELDEICEISGVNKFKHKLEFGWDTIIGERGCKLSGGERQRIGIARALAKKPQLLIFDEATSALDNISEREVQESINLSSKNITTIMIAHRLSTVIDCDSIMVFKMGRLIDSGTHKDLLERCEYYQELVKRGL